MVCSEKCLWRWNSLDTFDWIIFGRAFERTFLAVETVGCLVRFASVRSLVHRCTGKSERNSDSILHKHKCTFFFPRQVVFMVTVIGTSKARPRGDPENGPESEAGALRRTYLISTDSSQQMDKLATTEGADVCSVLHE